MNVYDVINSKDFLSKNQFERREIAKNNIIKVSDCKIDMVILCFENEILSNSIIFYNKTSVHETCNFTIGKEYVIIDCDKKRNLIKLKNDKGLNVWTTYKRFIYPLIYLRKEKLKKLNKI